MLMYEYIYGYIYELKPLPYVYMSDWCHTRTIADREHTQTHTLRVYSTYTYSTTTGRPGPQHACRILLDLGDRSTPGRGQGAHSTVRRTLHQLSHMRVCEAVWPMKSSVRALTSHRSSSRLAS